MQWFIAGLGCHPSQIRYKSHKHWGYISKTNKILTQGCKTLDHTCINPTWLEYIGLFKFYQCIEMDGWVTCNFTSFSTVFQSYQDNFCYFCIKHILWLLIQTVSETFQIRGQNKHTLWPLICTVSSRRFRWGVITYDGFNEKWEKLSLNYHQIPALM